MNEEINTKHINLTHHPMYAHLNSIKNVQIFMRYHVFVVWDFMSLLKSLQRQITCTQVPWTTSAFDPELVRLINEIVLSEESDLDENQNAIGHFDLYIKAMKEVGADTSLIENFIKTFDYDLLPKEIRRIVKYHIHLAENGKVHEVASSFFFGREKLIPHIFQSILDVLDHSNINCPGLVYYLKRHIEVDAQEHGPMALRCLNKLIDNQEKKEEVINIAKNSLELRWDLWTFIDEEIKRSS